MLAWWVGLYATAQAFALSDSIVLAAVVTVPTAVAVERVGRRTRLRREVRALALGVVAAYVLGAVALLGAVLAG